GRCAAKFPAASLRRRQWRACPLPEALAIQCARRGETTTRTVLSRPCQPARDALPTRSPYRPWSRPRILCAQCKRRKIRSLLQTAEDSAELPARQHARWRKAERGSSPPPVVSVSGGDCSRASLAVKRSRED